MWDTERIWGGTLISKHVGGVLICPYNMSECHYQCQKCIEHTCRLGGLQYVQITKKDQEFSKKGSVTCDPERKFFGVSKALGSWQTPVGGRWWWAELVAANHLSSWTYREFISRAVYPECFSPGPVDSDLVMTQFV